MPKSNVIATGIGIEVRRVPDRGLGGRGVFATRAFVADDVIERAPLLVIPKRDLEPRGLLMSYLFDVDRSKVGLGLGFLSLYNHRTHSNATWRIDRPDLMTITAVRPIAAGDEVTIHYFGEPGDEDEMPFEVL